MVVKCNFLYYLLKSIDLLNLHKLHGSIKMMHTKKSQTFYVMHAKKTHTTSLNFYREIIQTLGVQCSDVLPLPLT